jgi:hypothetical protein
VGTNNGNPYVVYSAPLAPGAFVDLGLEYWIPTRVPINIPNSNYLAQGVPTNNVTLPPGGGANAFSITSSKQLTNGNFLIVFQSTAGNRYTVLYSADPTFTTNIMTAQPSIVAPANWVQWIDDGPPKTISKPTSSPARYYKVQQN